MTPMVSPPQSPGGRAPARKGPLTVKPLDHVDPPKALPPVKYPKASDVIDPKYAPSNADVEKVFAQDADGGAAINEFIRTQVIADYPHILMQQPAGDRKDLAALLNAGFSDFIVNEYSARLGLDPNRVSRDNLHLVDITNNFGFNSARAAVVAGASALPAYMFGALTSFAFDPEFYGLKSLHRIDSVAELRTKQGLKKYAQNYLALLNAKNAKTFAMNVAKKAPPEGQIALVGTLTAFGLARAYNLLAQHTDKLPALHRASANRNPMQPELGNVDMSTFAEQLAVAWAGRTVGEGSWRIAKFWWLGEFKNLPAKDKINKATEAIVKSIPADIKIAGVVVAAMTMVAKATAQIELRDIPLAQFLKSRDILFENVSLDQTLKQYIQKNRGVEAVLQGSARMLATYLVVTGYRWPIARKFPWLKAAEEYYKPASNVANNVARWGSFAGMYYFMWPYTESFMQWAGLFEVPRKLVQEYNQNDLSNRYIPMRPIGNPWQGAVPRSTPIQSPASSQALNRGIYGQPLPGQRTQP